MVSVPVFVGLDYHQESVQVCVMDREGRILANDGARNDWRDIVRLVGATGLGVRAAIEACTGSANLAEELVTRAGWSVDLAHAGYVMRMKGNPDKTDYSDARLLADLERVGYLPQVWLAPENVFRKWLFRAAPVRKRGVFREQPLPHGRGSVREQPSETRSERVRELRVLVRHRQELVNERRNTRLRVSALLRQHRLRAPYHPWTRSRRNWCSQLTLRSTTQRTGPNPSARPVPLLGMTGSMPRFKRARRCNRES